MKKLAIPTLCICFLVMAAGCGSKSKKDFNKVFNADAQNFNAQSLQTIGQRTGITIPDGAKGLNLVNLGRETNPSFVAKIEIPAAAQQAVGSQIQQFPASAPVPYPLSDKMSWWNRSRATVRLDKHYMQNGKYVHAMLCDESGQWMLYLEWDSREAQPAQ